MLKRLGRTLSLTFLGTALALGVGGCYDSRLIIGDHPGYENDRPGGPPPWAPAHGRRANHEYRYYPDSEVYYDTGQGVYFYMRGDRWQVSARLPSRIRIDVDDYVSLDMDTDRPYRYHSDVVKKYPPGQMKKHSKGRGKGKNKWF